MLRTLWVTWSQRRHDAGATPSDLYLFPFPADFLGGETSLGDGKSKGGLTPLWKNVVGVTFYSFGAGDKLRWHVGLGLGGQ